MRVSSIFRAVVFFWPLLTLLGSLSPGPLGTTFAEETSASVIYDSRMFQAMEYRLVGPHRGGRVTAVTGIAAEPNTFFMGTTGGGVWKTTDAGEVWNNVSDEYFEAGAIGAIDVADSDPNVIYVGTGSACIRGNVSTGIGAYKSEDRGKSWAHVGLREAGQIGEIVIHPKNPDLVYVAALGHAFGPNPERGVFRSRDGGASWEKVLFVSDSTGAVDLAMNPRNPREIYAALWRAERKPWTLLSGSEDGGVYKTTDGGDTWDKLTQGLPEGLVGKLEVTVSPANPDRVWIILEAPEGRAGVYRSDDAGESWMRMNEDPTYTERPWYYNHIDADPLDENTVYINGELFWKSVDGGKTFFEIPTPHGDNHDLWMHPENPELMIQANDGGANVSTNGGKSWSTQFNQPTAEFYSVTVDNQFPYRLYGPQQDNSTISVPSRTAGTGITIQHWLSVGGCETGPIAVHPNDPNIVYAGCYAGRITRFDLRTNQSRQIRDYPEVMHGMAPRDLRYRFQWNSPILISPHDPDVIYHASQYLHRTTNEGQTWEIISPDLTRDDKEKQDFAGGPITHDMTGVEVYDTIFALAESPHERGVIWAGSNDGLIHLTRDNGKTWEAVTPQGLPEWSTVNRIEISPHEPGKVYIAAYRYRMDDFGPYIYRTRDYGQTWELLTDGENGIPADHPTRAVREDPNREGLLYAGTEFGLFVSFDDGARWQSLQLNLPHTPVTDLVVQQKDLVVATQGRSFWILDDLTPLHQLSDQVTLSRAHLFEPRDAFRTPGQQAGPDADFARDPIHGARLPMSRVGKNPPAGALIYYHLKDELEDLTLEILDHDGQLVRRFSSADNGKGEPALSASVGLNRFVWDLAYPGPELAAEPPMARYLSRGGPTAVPGTYQVRLTAGDRSETHSFQVQKDPRLDTTRVDFEAQFDLLMRIRDRVNEMHAGLRRVQTVREQLLDVTERRDADEEVKNEATKIRDQLEAIESAFIQTGTISPFSLPPKLTGKFAWVYTLVDSADARPTDASEERVQDLEEELGDLLNRLNAILEVDVTRLNTLLRDKGVGPVIVSRR